MCAFLLLPFSRNAYQNGWRRDCKVHKFIYFLYLQNEFIQCSLRQIQSISVWLYGVAAAVNSTLVGNILTLWREMAEWRNERTTKAKSNNKFAFLHGLTPAILQCIFIYQLSKTPENPSISMPSPAAYPLICWCNSVLWMDIGHKEATTTTK